MQLQLSVICTETGMHTFSKFEYIHSIALPTRKMALTSSFSLQRTQTTARVTICTQGCSYVRAEAYMRIAMNLRARKHRCKTFGVKYRILTRSRVKRTTSTSCHVLPSSTHPKPLDLALARLVAAIGPFGPHSSVRCFPESYRQDGRKTKTTKDGRD